MKVSGNGKGSGFLSPLGGMCQYVTLSVPLLTMMSCPITVLEYITVWRCSQGLTHALHKHSELQHCLVVYKSKPITHSIIKCAGWYGTVY